VPHALHVDAGQRLGLISPLVYGTNHGPWSVVTYDLRPQAEAAGITFLRFPGGNWGDQNTLRGYQVDQFIDLAQRMGAEPSISVRLTGGTPESAAELVRYANVESGYDIRYWSIGNEPSLYSEYDTVRYNPEWRTFAEAMRAVDPDILLIGPDLYQYSSEFAGEAEVWRLDPDHRAKRVGTWMVMGTVTLPAQSITLCVVSAGEQEKEQGLL